MASKGLYIHFIKSARHVPSLDIFEDRVDTLQETLDGIKLSLNSSDVVKAKVDQKSIDRWLLYCEQELEGLVMNAGGGGEGGGIEHTQDPWSSRQEDLGDQESR